MGDDKASGPDGFIAKIFKQVQQTVKPDVLAVITSYCQFQKLLFEVNSIPIAFVPKVPNASTMADIKPIECCNVVYKYITKILQQT